MAAKTQNFGVVGQCECPRRVSRHLFLFSARRKWLRELMRLRGAELFEMSTAANGEQSKFQMRWLLLLPSLPISSDGRAWGTRGHKVQELWKLCRFPNINRVHYIEVFNFAWFHKRDSQRTRSCIHSICFDQLLVSVSLNDMLRIMNVACGLNRAWILLTTIWFLGVIIEVWSNFQDDKACGKAVASAISTYGQRDFEGIQSHIPPHCSIVADILVDNSVLYWLYLILPYAWTVTVPIAVWLLGFGLRWVARGFHSRTS